MKTIIADSDRTEDKRVRGRSRGDSWSGREKIPGREKTALERVTMAKKKRAGYVPALPGLRGLVAG
jgi:hypothetical protein